MIGEGRQPPACTYSRQKVAAVAAGGVPQGRQRTVPAQRWQAAHAALPSRSQVGPRERAGPGVHKYSP